MSFRWFYFGVIALGLIGESVGISFAAETGEKEQFDSIFLRLVCEGRTVPTESDGSGGGLTSFGDAVLLLTHDGKIFSRDLRAISRKWRLKHRITVYLPTGGLPNSSVIRV